MGDKTTADAREILDKWNRHVISIQDVREFIETLAADIVVAQPGDYICKCGRHWRVVDEREQHEGDHDD